jgi:hypothetical protein
MAAGLEQLSGPAAEILANEDIGALFLGRRPAARESTARNAGPPTPGTPVQ